MALLSALLRPDLLSDARWECAPSSGGAHAPHDGWTPAAVPGTAAGSLRDLGDVGASMRDYDGSDWWFRCTFAAEPGDAPHRLVCEGIATVADVYLNGELMLHSTNMFEAHEVLISRLQTENELAIRCSALAPLLTPRRPRPRWKSPDLVHQNLRWFRTTLIGRQTSGVLSPAPVGPWRPVSLVPDSGPSGCVRRLVAGYDAGRGWLDVDVEITGAPVDASVHIEVAGTSTRIDAAADADGRFRVATRLELPNVDAWWPHTHGEPTLYEVSVRISGTQMSLGRIGFRTVSVDRTDGGFTLSVNDARLFCRGVCWTPLDPISLQATPDRLREILRLHREAGLNMLRVTGVGVYESDAFYDLCDELGMLVWQDCMFAFFDIPDTEDFRSEVETEVRQLLGRLSGRPSLTVVCGGSENEQQAAYLGLPPDRWVAPLSTDLLPALVEELAPGTVYVTSSPSGSALPSMVSSGPGHYFGVGAYLMPLEDARRAGVRFASECLSFGVPPEPVDSLEGLVATRGMGHAPAWKAVVHRDAGTGWDLEDVRDWYTRLLFDVDPTELRRVDPDRAYQLARATIAAVFDSTLSEWRRVGSSCDGAIVLQSHDTGFGAGLGILDGLGRPKVSWYVTRRLMQPSVVTWSDEGVNGLDLHVTSDALEDWTATVEVVALIDGETIAERVRLQVPVGGGGAVVSTATLFGGFRDLTYAHRFGRPVYDALVARILDAERTVSQAVFLPGKRLRPMERDLGLRARVQNDAGVARVTVTTTRFAQGVSFELDGWYAKDSWFDVIPGTPVVVDLVPTRAPAPPPRGRARAVNFDRDVSLEVVP